MGYSNNFYEGGYSSFSPKYGDVFTGYRINPKSFGMSTDPRTANVLQDASSKLNMGIKQIELSLVNPEIFDSVPKQQLQEINRLSKLTGAEISVHGPVTEASGIGQQGFNEIIRKGEEIRLSNVLERSHEVNPEGNVIVTVHSSQGIPGTNWEKLPDKEKGFEGKAKRIIVVDRDTGAMKTVLDEGKVFYPGEDWSNPENVNITPEHGLDVLNHSEWDQRVSKIFFEQERADEILQENQVQIQHLIPVLKERFERGEDPMVGLTPTQRNAYIKLQDAQGYLKEVQKSANTIFSKAYEFGDDEQKKKLKELSDKYTEELNESPDFLSRSQAMHRLVVDLKNRELAPRINVPLEEFAIKKSAETFGNAAFESYKKLGDKAPILSIENPPAGGAFSTGEELKDLIKESRKNFAERAIKDKGLNSSEANKLAEKFIGATWDLGHINMLRKSGFGKEDIIRESEKIAPFIKHVHLSDNFGIEHTELPMGMGNVPTKEIFEKLGKEGFDAKKIIEAGNWWNHFRTAPFKETLEAFGSPIYSMEMSPYWNQNLGLQQSYSSGYGMMLPQTNYQMFGAGFSQLPMELGGQKPGAEGSRMSGRGME